MHELDEAAAELLKKGDLDGAAKLFDEILSQQPTNAAALHSLGVIQGQRGEHRQAADLIAKAIALRPNIPAFYINLAEAYRNLGELKRAENSCLIALQLSPDSPEGLNTLGLVLHRSNRRAEAAEQFRRAIAMNPRMASALNNLGLVLQELEQHDEAIELFCRAIEASPDLNRARTNLGIALVGRGRAEEAVPHFQEAVRRQPDLPALHRNLGNALRALDRHAEARAAYLQALLIEPDSPSSHFYIGQTLRREGKLDEALPWYQRAVELDQDNPHPWKHLAELHGEREESRLAIACWERVLTLSPADRAVQHDAYIGLGSALQDEGRLAEAIEHYRSAADLQPSSAVALLSIGSVHQEQGELIEAEAAFRDAILLQPDFPIPHARLATLLRDKLADTDLEALNRRLSDPGLEPAHRGRLLFGLAHVLDARGDYPRAADCLRQANALALDHPKGGRGYDPANQQRLVEGALRVFDEALFERTRGAGSTTRRPVFVFGLPRSGTTLIEQILASHPQVHGAGELRLGRRTFESIPSLLQRSDSPIDCVPHLDASMIRRLADQHIDELRAVDDGRAERIVDKMPDNFMFLGILAILFPDGVFIHCRRDLRDVAVSCWMTDFGSIRWANHPEHIASRFTQYCRLMSHWRDVLPVPLHVVDYEETVADLEGVARRLLAACGLDWDPTCLEFHRTQRRVRTASVTQVRRPIYQDSVARWKKYERELADLFALLPLGEAAALRAEPAHGVATNNGGVVDHSDGTRPGDDPARHGPIVPNA